MGNHRMFANSIIDSDKFLDMPLTTQVLYFHLGMRADDDGFIGSPKKILRGVNCTEDDLKLLIAKGYLITFDSGVIAVTHWNVNNSIRKDRKKDTFYQTEMDMLCSENGIYSIDNDYGNRLTTTCQPTDNQVSAQDKVREDKISKDKIREDNTREDNKEKEEENLKNSSLSDSLSSRIDYDSVMYSYNRICTNLNTADKMTLSRRQAVDNAVNILGDTAFEELFERVQSSDFLSGRNGKWYGCNFDWILKPENLKKILSGAYDNPAPKPEPHEEYKPYHDRSKRNTSYDINELKKIDTLDFMDEPGWEEKAFASADEQNTGWDVPF